MQILLLTVIGLLGCTLAARLGRQFLICALIINLLSVGLFAQRLVPIVGYVTNITNVSYALTVFCSAILCEKFIFAKRMEPFYLGAFSLILFTILSQIIIAGDPTYIIVHAAPRNALAGFIGFSCAMGFFVSFWPLLNMPLWLKYMVLVVLTQALDSVLFFPIALGGILPVAKIIEIGTIGFVLKIVIGICSVPFLYIATRSKSLPS